MISVQGVEKRYGDTLAVSNLSFEIKRGEIVGLLGHNGAGKTTIMKVMTGYLEPTAGRVTIDGLDVIDDRLEVQRTIGYLPENAPLYEEMQVEEYLTLMADLRGVSRSARREAVETALEATGLIPRRRQVIQTLSKGYRQRVGLAQAIVHTPSILILDEPTNGLDPVQILEIRALIKRLAQDTTILISTHILSEIEAVCDRVVILIDGQLAADSQLETLLSSNALRLTIKGGADVADVLCLVDGVSGITALKADPNDASLPEGFVRYRVEISAQEGLAARLVRASIEAGWEVAEVTSDTQSLESVFRGLMTQHIEQASSATSSKSVEVSA